MSTVLTRGRKAPWHLRVLGIAALLWNGSGAYTIMMAQAGRLAGLDPGEAAYYASQPTWSVVATDLALVMATAAAIALLARRSVAVWMFALSLGAIFITNGYELAAGTSRMFVSGAALVVTVIIVLIAIFELVYARAMERRAVFR